MEPVPLNSVYQFSHFDTLGDLISAFIGPIFGFAGLLILLYLLYAGWKYITSQGDKEALAKARAMVIHSIIGAIILILLFLVMQFIPQIFGVGELAI